MKKSTWLYFFALAGYGLLIASAAGMHINFDTSIPTGVWWESEAPPGRGDYVLVRLENVSSVGYQRRYAGGSPFLGKKIVALWPDTVRVSPGGVFVNNQLVRYSRLLSEDSEGRYLPQLEEEYVLTKEQVFLMGEHGKSFDSRYFGPVETGHLITQIKPLVVL